MAAALGATGCTPSTQACSADQEAHIQRFSADLVASLVATNVSIDADVALPDVTGPYPHGNTAEGMLVVLDRHGLRIDGERVTQWRSGEGLIDEVDRRLAIAEATHRPAELTVVIAVAADVSTHVVVELLGLAQRLGFVRVGFLAVAADAVPIPPIPEPGLPAIIRERSGHDPDEELEVLSQLLEAEATQCPALGEPLPFGTVTSAGRDLILVETTRDRLLACHCAANVDRVLSLAHFYTAPTRITVISAALTFDQVLPVVKRRADAPWSEVAPAVFALAAEAEPT